MLIALIDPTLVGHDAAHEWFHEMGAASWATCPLTENGVVRIVVTRNTRIQRAPLRQPHHLSQVCALPDYVFWTDDLSLLGSDLVNAGQIMTPGQVTDSYLLALAVANKGQLATLDRRLSTKAVRHGAAPLHIIGGGG